MDPNADTVAEQVQFDSIFFLKNNKCTQDHRKVRQAKEQSPNCQTNTEGSKQESRSKNSNKSGRKT